MIDRAEFVHPLYVIGDSHALAYRNLVFQEKWAGGWFTTRARYISGLTAHDLYDPKTHQFAPAVVETLAYEGLVRKGKARHLSLDEQDFNIATAEGRPVTPPLLLFTCGDIDIRLILLPMLKDEYDFLAPFQSPYPRTDCALLPWDILREVMQHRIQPFIQGLQRLRQCGFNRTYVQLVTPPTLDDANFERRHGYHCPAPVRFKMVSAFNRMLSEACKDIGVPTVDIWQAVTENGYLRPEYELDGVHLVPETALMHLSQMLDHAINCQWDSVNHRRYELFYRMAVGEGRVFDREHEDGGDDAPRSLLPCANDPPRVCTEKAKPHIPESSHEWVTAAVEAYKEKGIVIIKNDAAVALRWREGLNFDRGVENRNSSWDWAGNSIAPYSKVIKTAVPPGELLGDLATIFKREDYQQFFQAILGCPITVANCRPVQSMPHTSEGIGPQSWHEDGCPPGVIRGVWYLTNVDEDTGPFQYLDKDGTPRTVLGSVGDLLVFDAMRLKHRAMPPRLNQRAALDFVFMPRLKDQEFTIISAGMNHWPADPFFYCIPGDKSTIRETAEKAATSVEQYYIKAAPNVVAFSSSAQEEPSDQVRPTGKNILIRTEPPAARRSTTRRIVGPLLRIVRTLTR